MDATASAAGIRKGIVVIHGIGPHGQSDTLLDIGQPLLQWVARWAKAKNLPVRFTNTLLAFSPLDDGVARDPPHAVLEVDDAAGGRRLTWVMAEVWWSYSIRRPGFQEILEWGWHQVWAVLAELREANNRRFARIWNPKPGASHSSSWMRWVNAINALVLIPTTYLVALLAIPPVFLLATAALIPIPALQNFIAVHLLRQFLEVNIAQFRTFLEDGVQAAAMRSRVEGVVDWLVRAQRCDETYVLGHSEGAVLAFDALCRLRDPKLLGSVQKLFTFGAGLNKAWLLEADPTRFPRPLPRHIHWVDFWTSYDPVPAGSLTPRPAAPRIYDPSAVTRAKESPPGALSPDPLPAEHSPEPGGPVSEEITGEMDLMTDHGAYWKNYEEFLARVAQEIDAPRFWQSGFWPGRPTHLALAERLWMRVSALVVMRLVATALCIMSLILQRPSLYAIGQDTWERLLRIPGFDRLLDPVVGSLYQALYSVSVAAAAAVRGVGLWLLAIGAIAALYVGAYGIGMHLAWAPLHAREQRDSVIRVAQGPGGSPTPWPRLWGLGMWLWLIALLALTGLVAWQPAARLVGWL
jgi:hypothetical protein